jgi:hypothetical protein
MHENQERLLQAMAVIENEGCSARGCAPWEWFRSFGYSHVWWVVRTNQYRVQFPKRRANQNCLKYKSTEGFHSQVAVRCSQSARGPY